MTGPLAEPVPALVDGLIALWGGAPELGYSVDGAAAQLRVVDGPLLDDVDDRRLLMVGTAAETVAGGAQVSSGYGLGGRREDRIELTCQLLVWSGSTDPSVVRSDGFAVLAVLAGLLGARRDLGGVVDWARVVRHGYEPVQAQAGAGARITFVVSAVATRFEGG